jgi:tetratricopeptide (TPR) repeat protein
MKVAWVLAVMLALLSDPLKLTRINEAKRDAREAYEKGDYATAIRHYRYLTDSLGVEEDEIHLNLAHAYYRSDDSVHTRSAYERVTRSGDARLRSTAYQQLGVMANAANRPEEALTLFKEALRANPSNADARYNYELVKKKLEEQEKQDQEQKKDNQDKKDQKDQKEQQKRDQQDNNQKKQDQKEKAQDQQTPQQQKEQQEKQQQEKQQQSGPQEQEKQQQPADPSLSDKLKEMKISEEKARMILEAMKNNEVQYLQQNKRKATKPKDKGKPDW